MKRLQLLSIFALTVSALSTPTLWGDTIQFANTGVAANGSLLAAGSTDSHYSLFYSPDPSATTAVATSANPAWQQNTSTAGWISPGASGNQNWGSGYYVYETFLNLTGYDPSTAILSGLIAADDEVYILLNRGGSPLYTGGGFSSSASFVINSGFVSGINEVDFVIHNDGGPTGLLVDDTVATATAVTPEPACLLLLASGAVFGVISLRQRFRRT